MMTVRDVVTHLLTLPQDLEVWSEWDESGEYSPSDPANPPGRVDTICPVCRFGKERWEEDTDPDNPAISVRKDVVVLLPELDPL